MSRVNFLVAATAALVVGACAVHPPGYSADDARISDNVRKALAQHPDLGPPNRIYVDTREGVVYLTGFATHGLVRDDAKEIAAQVAGVTRVENSVSVTY